MFLLFDPVSISHKLFILNNIDMHTLYSDTRYKCADSPQKAKIKHKIIPKGVVLGLDVYPYFINYCSGLNIGFL